MTVKQNNPHNGDEEEYNDVGYASYCDAMEGHYKQAKEDGIFEAFKILGLDEEHSDGNLVQAVNYFNKKDGLVEKDAPTDFLTEREKRAVNSNGVFRPHLYCMLLSIKFAEAIQGKSIFIQDSFKYSFDET